MSKKSVKRTVDLAKLPPLTKKQKAALAALVSVATVDPWAGKIKDITCAVKGSEIDLLRALRERISSSRPKAVVSCCVRRSPKLSIRNYFP
jgi:hypothetical protein